MKAFGLKVGTFPGLLVLASYPCRIDTLPHLLWPSGWHLTSDIGLVVNFKSMQQPTILVTFFQIREYSQDYRHRASLVFY